jgi:hypothetical protein
MSKEGKGIGGHTKANNGLTNDWLTPPEIIKALGPFDLDPCVPDSMPWQTANRMITESENGLAVSWDGFVWMNPPYGEQTNLWLKKMAEHSNGIALIFARTETKMFFDYVWSKATCLFFFQGRLFFHGTDGKKAQGNAGGPSVLIGYGEEASERIRNSLLVGAYVSLYPDRYKLKQPDLFQLPA